MIVTAKRNRKLSIENRQNTQNENKAETLLISVPEEYENYNKKIVFITPNETVWDIIQNNEYKLTNAITKYKTVEFYIWLTKDDVDFRSETYKITFNDNIDASDEITPEEIHGVNTVVNILEEEIDKVENIDITAERVSDGVEISITDKNGETTTTKVNDGQDGQDGYTPQKGIDYFTQADKEEIENAVEEDITPILNNKADKSEIPDVSDFITKSVNDLLNYYLKSDTYTKTEVNNLIGSIEQLHFEIVEELPSTGQSNIIYLVPRTDSEESNVYDEYMYVNNNWEKIGSTDIDLSDYVTTTQLNTALADYTTTADLTTLLNAKQNTIDNSHKLSSDLVDDTNNTNKFVTTQEKTTWNNKSDFSGNYNDLNNKPTIPDELADLQDDTTHRTVTDTEKTTWNGKVSQEEYVKTIAKKEASGNTVKIDDGFDDLPVIDLTVGIEPKQAGSGTPSPTNVRALSGWDSIKVKRLGKNLIDLTDRVQYPTTFNPTQNVNFDKKYIYFVYASSGYHTTRANFSYSIENNVITVLETNASAGDSGYGIGFNVEIKPNTTYTLSCSNTSVRVTFYDEDGKYISYASTKTFTTPVNAKHLIINCYISVGSQAGTDLTGVYSELQLEAGETATDYEPYNSQSTEVEINLGRTVYGGTLDVTTGELIVDKGIYTITYEDIPKSSSSADIVSITMNTMKLSHNFNGWCDKLPTVYSSADFGIRFGYNNNQVIYLYKLGTYYEVSTIMDLRTKMQSDNITFDVVYPLEESTTYQLTPVQINTLLGNNTVYADSGDSDLKYYADITEVLKEKVDDVQIDGTTIVSNGVANIPIATSSTAGVTKSYPNLGTTVYQGAMIIEGATDEAIKSPSSYSSWKRPILPTKQHASVFYGLAKAAGDTTQASSTNPVGTYTPEAKTKIMNMLGDKYELISTDVLAEDKTMFEKNINNYESAMVVFTLDTALTSTTYITGKFNLQNDTTEYTSFNGVTTSASKRVGVEFVRKASDLIETTLKRDGTSAMQVFTYVTSGAISKVKVSLSGNVIPTGTTIKIYGKGKV